MKNFTFYVACFGLLLLSSISIAQVQITFPTTRAVFQRGLNNQATVRVAGFYTSSVTRIEAKLTALNGGASFDWRTIQNSPTGGSFSGELTNVSGGWYRLEVRGMNNDQTVGYASLEPFGVGEVFIVAGQSNAQGVRPDGLPAGDDRVNTAIVGQQNESLADPSYPAFTKVDNNMVLAPRGFGPYYWGRLGDFLVQRLGVPVMFFNAGWGATTVRNWRESVEVGQTFNVYSQVPLPAGMPYGNLKQAAQFYANQYGLRAVLWHQGEADNFRDTPATQYTNDLLWLINRVQQDTGKRIPWVIARASYDSDMGGIDTKVINGQNVAINPSGGIFGGPNTDVILDRADNAHFNNAGLEKVAALWNSSLDDTFFNSAQPVAPASLATISAGCPGNNQVSYTVNGQFSSIVWETLNDQGQVVGADGGPTIIRGGGGNRYRAKVKDGFGNVSYSAAVRVADAPFVAPSGPTTFCEGGSVNLTANYENNISFINGQTNQVVTNNRVLTTNTSGSFFVRYRDVSGCEFNSQAVNVQVNPNPVAPVIANERPTTFCEGDNTILRVNADNVRYNWSTGETSQVIDVRRGGTYQVTITDQNGCSSPRSNAINVVVNPNPATPVIATNGPTTFCADRSITLTAPENASYQWSNGQTTRSITTNQAGSYTVRVRNQFNCVSAESSRLDVRVNPLPNAPTIAASGRTTFCEGDQVTLTATNSVSTFWSSGDSTQALTVRRSGTYTARTRDNNGCISPQSNAISVNARPLPATPTINQVGTFTLQAFGPTTEASYSWRRNTDSLAVRTSTLKAAQSGSYQVRSFIVYSPDLTCASPFSQPFAYTLDASFNGLSVYPNPTPTRQVTVETLENIQNAVIAVYSLSGQEIMTVPVPLFDDRKTLSLTNVSPGQYILQVRAPGFNQSKRILVGF